MWSQQFASMMIVVVMASLLRVSWELSRQTSSAAESDAHQAPVGLLSPSTGRNPDGTELMPWQKEWAEKAVRRYAEAQEKKWRRWNEAMFERT